MKSKILSTVSALTMSLFETTLLFWDAEGDDLKSESPKEAIAMFEKVVELEKAIGDQVKWYNLQAMQAQFNYITLFFPSAGVSRPCRT